MNDNWCALCISILKNVPPEMAFELLDNPSINKTKPKYIMNRTLTDKDIEDMIKLRAENTFVEIGQMYGISKDAVYRRIKRYKEENMKALN